MAEPRGTPRDPLQAVDGQAARNDGRFTRQRHEAQERVARAQPYRVSKKVRAVAQDNRRRRGRAPGARRSRRVQCCGDCLQRQRLRARVGVASGGPVDKESRRVAAVRRRWRRRRRRQRVRRRGEWRRHPRRGVAAEVRKLERVGDLAQAVRAHGGLHDAGVGGRVLSPGAVPRRIERRVRARCEARAAAAPRHLRGVAHEPPGRARSARQAAEGGRRESEEEQQLAKRRHLHLGLPPR